MEQKTKIYICHRKESGWELGKMIYESLLENKYETYIDMSNKKELINSAQKRKQIKDEISKYLIFIVILTRDSMEKCINENDKFFNEIKAAIELNTESNENNPIPAIIPIIDSRFSISDKLKNKLPKELQKLDLYNGIMISEKTYQYSINDLIKLIDEIEFNLVYGTKDTIARRVDNPYYLPKNIKAIKPLTNKEIDDQIAELKNKEKQNTFDFAQDVYKEIFKWYWMYYERFYKEKDKEVFHRVNVLDIGCGTGFFAKSLIESGSLPFNRYLGVDSNKNKIEIAKKYMLDEYSKADKMFFNIILQEDNPNTFDSETKSDEKFLTDIGRVYRESFFTSFKEQLDSINNKTEAYINKTGKKVVIEPEVAIINFVLNNFQDTIPLLSSTKDLIKEGGLVIINEIDDGYDLYCHDEDGLFKKFKQIVSYDPYMGNRFTGREMEYRMNSVGLRHVKLWNIHKTSDLRMSIAERVKVFKKQYNKLIKDFTLLLKTNPNNKQISLSLKWLQNNYKALINLVSDKEFYWCRSFLIWTGVK